MNFRRSLVAGLAVVAATVGVSTPAQAAVGNQVTGSTLQLSASWDVRFSVRWDAPSNPDNADARYVVVSSKGKLASIYYTRMYDQGDGEHVGETVNITAGQTLKDGRWVVRADPSVPNAADRIFFSIEAPSGITGNCSVWNFVPSHVC